MRGQYRTHGTDEKYIQNFSKETEMQGTNLETQVYLTKQITDWDHGVAWILRS